MSGMSCSDFRTATVGETLAFISAYHKKMKAENEKEIHLLKIQRMNTFYLVRAMGVENIKEPTELYHLPDDDVKEIEDIDPFSDENNKLFDNFN